MPAAIEAGPPAQIDERSPIDKQVLEGIRAMERDGAKGILDRVLRLYLQGTPLILDQLRQALDRSDVQQLQNAAHTLKSSSANVGAMQLSALCRELESLGRSSTLAGAAERVAQVDAEFLRVRRELSSWCGGPA
jgi:HPt (histidine-containing phosphotransfer) domain-containing protein